MIDLAAENLIALRDVPQCLPPRPNGKRLHISAVYRWTLRGVKGVVLESIRIGGTTYTSREALQRFSERLTGPAPAEFSPGTVNRVRQRQLDQANAAVSKALGHCKSPHDGRKPSSF